MLTIAAARRISRPTPVNVNIEPMKKIGNKVSSKFNDWRACSRTNGDSSFLTRKRMSGSSQPSRMDPIWVQTAVLRSEGGVCQNPSDPVPKACGGNSRESYSAWSAAGPWAPGETE